MLQAQSRPRVKPRSRPFPGPMQVHAPKEDRLAGQLRVATPVNVEHWHGLKQRRQEDCHSPCPTGSVGQSDRQRIEAQSGQRVEDLPSPQDRLGSRPPRQLCQGRCRAVEPEMISEAGNRGIGSPPREKPTVVQ